VSGTDVSLTKTPHKKTSYTMQQAVEFARCADPVGGPEYFMSNFFYIQHPTKGKLLYAPFAYQKRLIDVYHNNRFSISMMPRQTGKTTSAAGYLLWYAMFVPDSTVLIAAHKYAGAHEIMLRIRYAYELCPDHIRCGVVTYNKGSVDFDNGSRIVAQSTTDNTGRGMSISLLYADEFAFVRPTIAREFWTAISPTLSTGGKAIITSTPNSDEDQFSFIWQQANKTLDEYGNETSVGINGFKAFRSEWWEHPDRDEAWAAEERGRIGEEKFRREYGLEFLIADDTLINSFTLSLLESYDPIEKIGHVRWYEKPKKGNIYVVGLDPSLGTGRDPAAIQVFNANTLVQVAEWTHNKTPIPQQIKTMVEIVEYINSIVEDPTNIYYSVENNTIGEAALISISDYGEERIQGVFLSDPKATRMPGVRKRKGFNTTAKSKIAACAKIKNLIETKRLKISSRALVSELKNFVGIGNSYAAKPGETDDLVMSTILVVRMLQHLQNYHAELADQVTDHDDEKREPLPFIMVC